MQCPSLAPTMVPINNVYSNESRRFSEIPSLLKNHRNINQPNMNPATNRSEYHLSPNDPI